MHLAMKSNQGEPVNIGQYAMATPSHTTMTLKTSCSGQTFHVGHAECVVEDSLTLYHSPSPERVDASVYHEHYRRDLSTPVFEKTMNFTFAPYSYAKARHFIPREEQLTISLRRLVMEINNSLVLSEHDRLTLHNIRQRSATHERRVQ